MFELTGIWTAFLLAALCASALAWVAALLHERVVNPLRRLRAARPVSAPFQTALLVIVAIGFIHHGATKSTNGVPDRAGGYAPPSLRDTPSVLEGEQGFAATTNADWLAFGANEDWMYVQDGNWCFRFGSNLVERVTVLSCGDVYVSPFSASNRISVLGIPFSIVPAANWHMLPDGRESLFWHSVTPSNSLLLTWRNALLLRDTNMPVTVQAELFPDGAAQLRYDLSGLADVSALTDAAAMIWRDGAVETASLQTGEVASVEFAAPEIAGTNTLDEVYARMAGGNSNAYYFADVAVSKGPARLSVDGSGESALGDYEIMADPGVTNRLPLLIGERYQISSEAAFSHIAFGCSDMQTPESHPVATNIADRIVEVEWPVAFSAEATMVTPADRVYRLRVSPDGLNGTVLWDIAATNAPMRGAPMLRSGDGCGCGCMSVVEGGTNEIAHASFCGCDECVVSGTYSYEGFGLPFELRFVGATGGGGGTEPDQEEPPDPDPPPPPDPPSVSVSFDKDVVIFEDGYEDSPGVFKPRRSTTTKLTVTASGGENGGILSLNVGASLAKCAGQSEMPTYVPPQGTIEWQANYEGVSASADVGNTLATVRLMDFVTLQTIDASYSTTVAKVKIKAEITAPQNPCWQRHDYGVCERVVLQHWPETANVIWSTAGNGTIQSELHTILACPPLGGTEALTASYQGETFGIDLNVIEPQGIVASNVTAIADILPIGTAGHVGMHMDQYVAPFNVSFSRIAIEEVPSEEGFHSGYYSDPSWSNLWSHTYSNGAGKWIKVHGGNYIAKDRASCGACPPPWSQGSLIWNIPFGWHPFTADGDVPAMGILPTNEFATDVTSTIVINSAGFVILMKLGHWVSRDIYNEVALDGVVVMEGEQ